MSSKPSSKAITTPKGSGLPRKQTTLSVSSSSEEETPAVRPRPVGASKTTPSKTPSKGTPAGKVTPRKIIVRKAETETSSSSEMTPITPKVAKRMPVKAETQPKTPAKVTAKKVVLESSSEEEEEEKPKVTPAKKAVKKAVLESSSEEEEKPSTKKPSTKKPSTKKPVMHEDSSEEDAPLVTPRPRNRPMTPKQRTPKPKMEVSSEEEEEGEPRVVNPKRKVVGKEGVGAKSTQKEQEKKEGEKKKEQEKKEQEEKRLEVEAAKKKEQEKKEQEKKEKEKKKEQEKKEQEEKKRKEKEQEEKRKEKEQEKKKEQEEKKRKEKEQEKKRKEKEKEQEKGRQSSEESEGEPVIAPKPGTRKKSNAKPAPVKKPAPVEEEKTWTGELPALPPDIAIEDEPEAEEEIVDEWTEEQVTFPPLTMEERPKRLTGPLLGLRLLPDDPFVLHCLLDGFLSNELGNVSTLTNIKFTEVLYELERLKRLDPWGKTVRSELEAGNGLVDYGNPSRDNSELSLKERLAGEAKTSSVAERDCVITGGYRKYFGGGHAISFRISVAKKTIILTNTGEGIEKHSQGKQGYYALYRVFQAKKKEDFSKAYQHLMVAIKSPYIDNIALAYEHQVTNLPGLKEIDTDFEYKDTGTLGHADGVDPTWITHKSNWYIVNGRIYAKPQITGTCTFHSTFWQLLLEAWKHGGSMNACRFEKSFRDCLLEHMIYFGVPENAAGSQQLTCMQLLVRKYRSFQGREIALQTLRLLPQRALVLDDPKFLMGVEVTGVNESSTLLDSIAVSLKVIKKGNTLAEVILPLLEVSEHLFASSLDVGNSASNRPAHKDYYSWYCFQLLNGALQHAYGLKVGVAEAQHLSYCASLIKTTRTLLQVYYHDTITMEVLPSLVLVVAITAKLYNALDEKYKLPPHPLPYREGNPLPYEDEGYPFFGPAPDCETASFIRHHANYGYADSIAVDSPIVKQWKKLSGERARNMTVHVTPYSTDTPVPKAFYDFISTNVINAAIGSIFSLLRMRVDLRYGNYTRTGSFILPAQLGAKPVPLVLERRDPEPLTMFADLESGRPLSEIKLSYYYLPLPVEMNSFCESKTENLISRTKSYADPAVYYRLRKEWMQSVCLKIAPALKDNLTDPNLCLRLAIWLIYLWPEGPPPIIDASLPALIQNAAAPAAANIFTYWRSGGRAGSLARIVEDSVKNYHHFIEGTRSNTNNGYLILLSTFLRSCFYLPESAVAILSDLGGLALGRKAGYLPDETLTRFPNFIKEAHSWGPDGNYTYDGKKIIRPFDLAGSLQAWYAKLASEKRLANVLWLREDGTTVLELHFGNEFVTLTRDQLITPTGEEYSLVTPDQVPLLMRKWCYYYENALAIPLKQVQDGKVVWSFFLAGTNKLVSGFSVFDKSSYNVPYVFNTEEEWQIYQMQTCGVGPLLSYTNTNWLFLLTQLIKSVKYSCLSYLIKILNNRWLSRLPDGEFRSNVTKLITNTLVLFSKIFGVTMTATNNFSLDLNSIQIRQGSQLLSEYTKYITKEYNEAEGKYGSAEERLAPVYSTAINLPSYENNIKCLLRVVYERYGYPEGYNPASRPMVQALFEVLSGLIVRPNQMILYQRIKRDLTSETATIRIALMGIGKSKVILPMLALAALRSGVRDLMIVQPEHLVPQTHITFDRILPLIMNGSVYTVISDVKAKETQLNLINSVGPFGWERTVIFDEIDMMYNPFRSEFNQPSQKIKHPLKHSLAEYYKYIVALSYDEESKGEGLGEDFLAKVKHNLAEAKRMLYIYHYGLSKDLTNLLAVPYSAVDTPIENSVFSDIDLTAILSCLIRRKDGLNHRDFVFLRQRLYHWHNLIGIEVIANIQVSELLTGELESIIEKYGRDRKLQIFYLANVLLPEKLHAYKKQYNISFIDLMAPIYSKQRVGFSGTNLIAKLPEFADHPWKTIIADSNGEAAIKKAILGWNEQGAVHRYRKDMFWNVLCEPQHNYTVLIDADALLRKKGAALNVVKQWSEEDQKRGSKDYLYVFLDEEHIAREYSPGALKYPIYRYRSNGKYKWYYDQKHCIGIDLELHKKLTALTLVREQSRLTDVAQAIYRLRKLGPEMQETHFMFKSKSSDEITRTQLYALFLKNDDAYKKSMLPRHNLQNVKAIYRQELKGSYEAYEEEVRYFPDKIKLPDLTSSFGKAFLKRVGKIVLSQEGATDVQQVHEYEQEKEKEKEKEKIAPDEGKVACFSRDMMPINLLRSYVDIGGGFDEIDYSMNLALSTEVIRRVGWVEKQLDSLCYIYIESKPVLVITLAEAMLLRARGYKEGNIYYRYSTYPEPHGIFRSSKKESDIWSIYLAAGICGRHLLLHEQLVVIKATRTASNREYLIKLMKCLGVLRYELLADFVASNKTSEAYLKDFIKADYSIFLNQWVRWNVDNETIQAYYKKCLALLKDK